MPRAIISAGHTSDSPGTIVDGIREVDVARKLAKQVIAKLRGTGIITLSVPYDMPLDQRLAWINSTGYKAELGDILVEIHANEGGLSGVETWYVDDGDGKSKNLSSTLANSIGNATGLKVQGVNNEKTHEIKSIKVLSQTSPIAALIECLYLDNKEDQQFLKDESKIDILTDSIARGIAKFMNVAYKTTTVASSHSPSGDIISSKTIEAKKFDEKPIGEKPMDNRPSTNKSATQAKPIVHKNIKTNAIPQPIMGNPIKPMTSFDDGFGDDDADMDSLGGNSFGGNSFNGNNFAGGAGNNNFANNNFPPTNPGFGNPSAGYGGGAGSFGANPGGFGGGAGGFGAAANKPVMSRDDRKEMVKKLYKKGLGREPEQSELNYFLNIGISEEQMYKRLFDSQDHVDMMENSKQYVDLKKKFDEIETRTEKSERQLHDQKLIMEKLNSLLLQKNKALGDMQKKIQLLVARMEQMQMSKKYNKVDLGYKGNWLDQIFNYFSRRLS